MSSVKSKEKLSAHDRNTLSRETILKWYRAKRLEKLRILRDEIIGLSAAKREKLKDMIIENTKRELAIYKKSLTPAQRQKKAKEFADTLFEFALSKQNLSEFAKKYDVQMKSDGSKNLMRYWLENNPNGEYGSIKESPSYYALSTFENRFIAKEAFVLFRLIEEYWGVDEARKQLYNMFNGKTYDLNKLRAFFTKERSGRKLGFYYGTRKIKWNPNWTWRTYINPRNWFGDKEKTFTLTGWFVVNEGQKNKDYYTTSAHKWKKFVKGIKGDIYTKSQFLHRCVGKIRTLIKKTHIPAPDQADIMKYLEDVAGKARTLSKKRVRVDLLKWFKQAPHAKWIQPPQEIINKLTFVYGEGCEKYLYRYEPKQKKVYVVSLEDADVKDEYFGGYIKADKKSLGYWTVFDEKNTKKALKALIEAKSATSINREVLDYKLKYDAADVSDDAKLRRSSGLVAKLKGVPKYANYHNMDEGYFVVVEKLIKKYFIGKKLSEKIAEELAQVRVRYMKNKINPLIESDELIQEAIEENDRVKLKIVIDSKDEIKVLLADSKLKKKLLGARKKLEEAETSAVSVEGAAYKKLETRVEKMFGPVAPVVMWILDKFFKVKSAIKKLFTGKRSSVAGIVLGAFGINVSKDVIGSKKMTKERFARLIKSKKRVIKLKRKLFFDEGVKLDGVKIIIPKGKGIKLEKSMRIHLKGKGKFTAYPPKKKKGLSIRSLIGRIKSSKYMYRDSVIVIENGTTIPKGTIIPKGAKIKRIN